MILGLIFLAPTLSVSAIDSFLGLNLIYETNIINIIIIATIVFLLLIYYATREENSKIFKN
ncbi:hypothetical protein AMET1_1448 [Methanonatronarchaeum thermophilum]|uniref:Uncharacterized protein n=1 Tax=Methanonatronarchaeum thermophilum TaxID=1927129 RepID=A0A1Y3GAU2_9EURY|nr:hypothetical protein [Methanonatronarchaeum thermophilum]OUJ18529.1 hypothetical protein AMET1_1448 [Methanonatronarchaeum thermophilum]